MMQCFKRITGLLILSSGLLFNSIALGQSVKLVPIYDETTSLYGYKEEGSGTIKLQPIYEDASSFSEGLAVVKKDGKWGYINTSFQLVIPFNSWYSAGYFVNGCAKITEFSPAGNGGKCGYIDKTGKMVIPAIYEYAWPFKNGIAIVNSGGSKNYYLDSEKGYVEDFSGGKWGGLDQNGNVVIPFDYDEYTMCWSANVFCFRKDDSYGVTDSRGKILFDFIYLNKPDFKEGMCFLTRDNVLWSLADTLGRIIVKDKFMQVSDFHEGLAAVSEDGANIGFIDKTGAYKIKPQYASVSGFQEGRAAVSVDGEKFGFIDSKGIVVVPIQYNDVRNFSGGMAVVGNFLEEDDYFDPENPTGQYGAIDKNGKIIIPLEYESVYEDEQDANRVVFYKGTEEFVFDKKGNRISD